jgi:hypothetical protein
MFKVPEFLDIWKINEITNGVIIDINDDRIRLLCKDKITGKIYFKNEKLIKTDDNIYKYKLFNENYEFISKSKLIETIFEIM